MLAWYIGAEPMTSIGNILGTRPDKLKSPQATLQYTIFLNFGTKAGTFNHFIALTDNYYLFLL